MVIDAITIASHSVAELLSLAIEVPPVPIESIKREKDKGTKEDSEKIPDHYKVPPNKIQVYEIWKVFLEDNPKEISEAYVIISSDFISEEYQKGVWKNVRYRGCYSTVQEAKNEIDGYLR